MFIQGILSSSSVITEGAPESLQIFGFVADISGNLVYPARVSCLVLSQVVRQEGIFIFLALPLAIPFGICDITLASEFSSMAKFLLSEPKISTDAFVERQMCTAGNPGH